jgi:glycerol-3-phosphate O-acyltransferase / dihydroxyacetone phosphate acyltransferase
MENMPRAVLLWRLLIRVCATAFLLVISLPGLVLWAPIFSTTTYFVKRLKASGPTWDTQDEIAQTKLLYGLGSGSVVCIGVVLASKHFMGWPILITMWAIPGWMWMTLRWTEDLVSAFRASMALFRLLTIPTAELRRIREGRKGLYRRVMEVAESLGLPSDPEQEFIRMKKNIDEVTETGWIRRRDRKGTVRGRWDSAAQYFSIRRRRKRDWNETLRWFDATEFPKDE